VDKFISMTDELYRYVVEYGTRQDQVLRELATETEAMGDIAVMQTAPDQGALITLLVGATGARRALELGTFTGYGAVCIARGLPVDGRLLTCELSEEFAATAQRWIERADLADRVNIAIGPALDTLRGLPEGDELDFAYIDADKPNYPIYYEETLGRLRPGGMVMLDNTLYSGAVLAPESSENAAAIHALNERIAADDRVDVAMLGISDGVTLVRKR
jgi:predicted O-methyltransferase YrrM